MTKANSIKGIAVSLMIGALIILAGSQGSIQLQGLPLFLICGAIGFVLHWAVFAPSYAFQTEHYFDLTGSISYITTVIAALLLNPTLDIRDIIIAAMIGIWALRLGSFLFWRIKKDGQDKRFIQMKTQFLWFLMTWTLGGLWVLVTMAAGLAAGRTRGFAFEQLAGFDAQAWEAMKAEAKGHAPKARFYGFDRDDGAIRGARANAERAGLSDFTSFERQAISDLTPPDGPPGLVMVNPPYGARIGNRKLLFGLYGALGATLKAQFKGWRVGLVTSDGGLAKSTGLNWDTPAAPVAFGGLSVTLWQTHIS